MRNENKYREERTYIEINLHKKNQIRKFFVIQNKCPCTDLSKWQNENTTKTAQVK